MSPRIVRYSKKRQAILDCLRQTKAHPSAEWIYEQLKPAYPRLSLATVYRNLSQLKDAGEVLSMGNVLGQERFDGNISPHTHVICKNCGTILDVFEVTLPPETVKEAEKHSDYSLMGADLRFEGLCPACRDRE